MLCNEKLSIGSGMNGAFAEYMIIPEFLVFVIPDQISLEEAVLCEPLACAVRSVVEMSSVKAGDYVLISGPGTMGQLVMQLANISGGKTLVAGTFSDSERMNIALKTGADKVVNISKADATKEMLEFTNGEGFDVAFECSGVESSADLCLQLLRKAGQYSQVGLYGEPILFNHDLALTKGIKIVNSYASERSSWAKAIRLLEWKRINTDVFINRKYKFEEFREAFEAAQNRECLKILLTP
jgi:L-iditol 2-dehydrogenase